MISAKDQLRRTSRQFTRSLVLVLLCVWFLLEIYIANTEQARIKTEVGNWISHNKSKIEEYLFVENTLALNGLFQNLVERLSNKNALQKISIVSWDGTETTVLNDDRSKASSLGNMNHLLKMTFTEDLRFADRSLGQLVIQAPRDIRRMIIDSVIVGILLAAIFFALLYLRNILISEVDRTLVFPMQLLRTQMKSGLVLDLGVTTEDKQRNWSKESLELENSYVELIRRLDAITKQRESDAKLVAAGEVAARVAHDIRSPLTALEIAAANMPSVSPEVRDLITQANKRIRDIASKLFAQARCSDIEADGFTLSERMNSAIERLVAEKRSQFENRIATGEIALRHSVSSINRPAKLNPDEIARIVSNLLDNAIEAIPQSGNVKLELENSTDGVLVRVSDSGKGISESLIKRLGEPGFTFAKVNGSGYGLFSVKRAVEHCGGSLAFDSTPGRGTTVTVSIPFV